MNSLEEDRFALKALSALSRSLVTQRLLSYYDSCKSHGQTWLLNLSLLSLCSCAQKSLFIINHPVCASLEYKMF